MRGEIGEWVDKLLLPVQPLILKRSFIKCSTWVVKNEMCKLSYRAQ